MDMKVFITFLEYMVVEEANDRENEPLRLLRDQTCHFENIHREEESTRPTLPIILSNIASRSLAIASNLRLSSPESQSNWTHKGKWLFGKGPTRIGTSGVPCTLRHIK
jgi:hypothetical protein